MNIKPTADLPNMGIEEMIKIGEMPLFDRSNWTSVVGKFYPTYEEKQIVEEMVRLLKVNNKVLVSTLINDLEEIAVNRMLELGGTVVIIEHRPYEEKMKECHKEIHEKVLKLGGTVLYPYNQKTNESKTEDNGGINKIKFERIMETYLIRARLSDTIVRIDEYMENNEEINGLERFALSYGRLLNKKVFNYNGKGFEPPNNVNLCHIYWDIEYKPLRKYIIRDKF